jgi:rsbT co-antagonist protein RsbR
MDDAVSAEPTNHALNASTDPALIQQMAHELEEVRRKLRVAEQQLAAVFEHVPYPIAIMDMHPDGQYFPVVANPVMVQLLGLATNASSEENDRLFSQETIEETRARLRATLEAGKPLAFEETIQMLDRTVWTQSLYIPIPGTDPGHHWVTIASFDISAQKRREQEELAARESIIERQALSLNELSTPLLAISDDVVVLPLIGAIDTRRAQQIIETLLTGISETRAKTAIIDITGVIVVDTQVANAILRAAQAAQLLGAQVILTGIRPEIAQVMISLGVDLGTIITRSTLQAGIAHSMRRGE